MLMKKLLTFLFVLLMAGTALANNLTDANEQSQKPVCYLESLTEDSILFYMTGPDGAELYFAVEHNYEEGAEFFPYDGPVLFTEPGNYRVMAFAIEPGKDPSDLCELNFVICENPQPWLIPDPPYIDIEQLEDGSCKVTIEPYDTGGQLFYHVNVHYGDGQLVPYGEFESLYDYQPYPGPLLFTEPGHYEISAYTWRPGEAQSYHAYDSCTVTAPAPLERTGAPVFMGESIEDDGKYVGYRVTIIPTEPSDLYYRTMIRTNPDEWEWEVLSDWATYTEPIEFRTDGFYRVEAYAIAEGKAESEHIAYECQVEIPKVSYDFEEDGIFYKIIDDGMVSVTAETTDYYYNTSYSGDVVIPDFVTHNGVTYQVCAIGERAFLCSNVTSVTLGDCVTSIGEKAFWDCSNLSEMVLGDYVIEVGSDAFGSCYHLTKLTIGSGVARIGSGAFANCSLQEIICKPATPPVMADSDCFTCYDTATLQVHPAVANSYRATSYWNMFANIVAEKKVAPAPGDVNGDGQLNVSDVTTILNSLLNGN